LQKLGLRIFMRQGTPLIVASQPEAAKNIIKILAADQKIPTFFYGEDFAISVNQKSGEFDFSCAEVCLKNLPKPALAGLHQYQNFAAAIMAANLITNYELPISSIGEAVKSVAWPSRLEKVENSLSEILPKNSEIFIDGAHNEAGARAVADWLLSSNQVAKKTFVICGFSKNKCKKEFLEKFRNVADIVATRVDGEPYPESSEKISEVGKLVGLEIHPAENLLEAIYHIKEVSNNLPCRLVICGSLHLARDVKKFAQMEIYSPSSSSKN
jgi:dihydrofolate synthase/folylpolyglutamate synthase